MNEELTQEQINKAQQYFEQHQEQLRSGAAVANAWYPPTDFEDKNNPMIWKTNHWKWFIKKYNHEKTNHSGDSPTQEQRGSSIYSSGGYWKRLEEYFKSGLLYFKRK